LRQIGATGDNLPQEYRFIYAGEMGRRSVKAADQRGDWVLL
jgi:hypothetical protein